MSIKCKCGGELVIPKTFPMAMATYVVCTSCGYSESLARHIFTVEPLPGSVKPIFLKDTEDDAD